MKVLYFTRAYSPHDHRFLSALSKTEHEVYFARLEPAGKTSDDRIVPSNIEQIQWAGGYTPFRWRDAPKLIRSLRGVLRRIRPDLIHAGPIQTCAFLALRSGFRPVLTMSWGFDLMEDAERDQWQRWLTQYTLKRSTFFVSDAEVTRQRAIAYGMDARRTLVFPWGVDLKHFSPAPRSQKKDGPFTLFCNRSWEPRYGVDVLARAFVRAAREREDLRLLLLGGGSQGRLIQDILQKGGVWARVSMPGYISQKDLPRYYRMADIYISPSHIDGSSVSLMEALACGLPALVSDIPANKEWVVEGKNGFLFPDGDVDALAQKILQVSKSRDTLIPIGENARSVAETRADWTKNFQKLLEAYTLTLKFQT
jgi:glycosyltransferase involved in cell wall biosynthesis